MCYFVYREWKVKVFIIYLGRRRLIEIDLRIASRIGLNVSLEWFLSAEFDVVVRSTAPCSFCLPLSL